MASVGTDTDTGTGTGGSDTPSAATAAGAAVTTAIESEPTNAWLSRTPSIMDVVLDLNMEYNYETLIDVFQRRRQTLRTHGHSAVHALQDERGLEVYWADQAAIWRGTRIREGSVSSRFPDSGERSTASWES
ncbi:hypothetical protein H0H81_011582 [Sphagnurus paluster]|uniref:Uncharacterized protein n=1 Tax=Sphagnurus paluster TaxID=117069 RepID=A0A9P7GX34_9AGAR|nr:hypothetical protein H0H81_011582 [Sphagnurus paluster]